MGAPGARVLAAAVLRVAGAIRALRLALQTGGILVCLVATILFCACSDERASASLAAGPTCTQDYSAGSQPLAVGFEQASSWTVIQGQPTAQVVGLSSSHTQGSSSLSVRTSIFTVLESAKMSPPATVTSTLAFDIMQPTRPATWWLGSAQLYANAPSAGIYNQFLSQVELTGSPSNAWLTLNFTVDAAAQAKIRAATNDLTYRLNINPPSGTTLPYLFDNLRFVGPCTDAGVPDADSAADVRPDADADAITDARDGDAVADVRQDVSDATDARDSADVFDALDADTAETEPESTRCGDQIVGLNEACDDGLGDASSTRRSCNAACQAVPISLLPEPTADASVTVAPWRLGQGRHPVGSSSAGFAVVLQEPDGPSVGLTRVSRLGVPSDRVTVVSTGVRPAVDANPVVAGLPNGSFAVAFNALSADGDHLGVALRIVTVDGTVLDRGFANSTTSFSQYDPDVVLAGSTVTVAWVDTRNAALGTDLYMRSFDADLRPLGNDQELAATTDFEGDVTLEAFETGWIAAWRSELGGQESLRVHSSSGTDWTMGPYLPGPTGDKPALGVDGARVAAVVTVGVDSEVGPYSSLLRGAELLAGGGTVTGVDILGASSRPHTPSASGSALVTVQTDGADVFETLLLGSVTGQTSANSKVALRGFADHDRPALGVWMGRQRNGLLLAATADSRAQVSLAPSNFSLATTH